MLFKEVKELFIKELVLKFYKSSLLIKVKIDTLDFYTKSISNTAVSR